MITPWIQALHLLSFAGLLRCVSPAERDPVTIDVRPIHGWKGFVPVLQCSNHLLFSKHSIETQFQFAFIII